MLLKPFAAGARISLDCPTKVTKVMKNAVPLFLAMIPLLAMIGACVAVP